MPRRRLLAANRWRLGVGCNRLWILVAITGDSAATGRPAASATAGGDIPASIPRTSCFNIRSRSAWMSSCRTRSLGSDSQAGKRLAGMEEKREKSSQKVSMSSWCGQTTTSGPTAAGSNSAAAGTSAAATSAHDDPQTPSSVAGCPRDSADTTSAKPSCSFRRRASSRIRSDAALARDEPPMVVG